MELRFEIPIEPKSKKNSQRILINPKTHSPFIMPSKAYKDWESECIKYAPKLAQPINIPVNIKALYFMKTRRKVDITNLHSALSDMLVLAKIISDDNRDVAAAYDGSRVYYDKENPRVEITITDLDEEYMLFSKGG